MHNSSRLVDERGRMNAKPMVDARYHPDHDVITGHACLCCGGPWEVSIDNGAFCLDCRKNRILDIHKVIDKRNAKKAIEDQMKQMEWYRRKRDEGKIGEAYKNRPGGKRAGATSGFWGSFSGFDYSNKGKRKHDEED